MARVNTDELVVDNANDIKRMDKHLHGLTVEFRKLADEVRIYSVGKFLDKESGAKLAQAIAKREFEMKIKESDKSYKKYVLEQLDTRLQKTDQRLKLLESQMKGVMSKVKKN